MDTYSTLRHFADSWGLLAMVLFFGSIILFTFRPGSTSVHKDAANIPLRHGDDLEADTAQKTPQKEART